MREIAPSPASQDWAAMLIVANNRLNERFGEANVEFFPEDVASTDAPNTFVFHAHVAEKELNHASIDAAQIRTDLLSEFGMPASRVLILVLPGDLCGDDTD